MHDFVSVDNVRLEYEWHGPSPVHAPTIVFLHEGLGSISQWRGFPAELSSRLGCGALVYNRCGHGRSDAPNGPRTTRFMHEEAITVLPRLVDMFEIRRPVVVGHSDGASIALIFAGSGAGDPFGLILEAPHVFVEDVTVNRIAELRDLYRTTDLRTRLARHHGANVDTLFESWTDVWLRPQFRRWNIEQYLPDVTCPTLIIQGKQDEYGTDRHVNALLSTLGGRCEGVMLEQCGHSPHIDQRATVSDLIVRFVRGL
jgi:pimeloyl-ACP methyl ester carboxylesterase